MWTILPEIEENQGIKSKRLGYTYLHGELEKECGYDIYGFINCELPLVKEDCSYIDDSALKNGDYPCVYKNKKCTLYFWHDNINRPHGLVVYNDDKESVRYAKEMLKLKPIFI